MEPRVFSVLTYLLPDGSLSTLAGYVTFTAYKITTTDGVLGIYGSATAPNLLTESYALGQWLHCREVPYTPSADTDNL